MIRGWFRRKRVRTTARKERPCAVPLRSGAELLEAQATRLSRIRREAGVPSAQWRTLYRTLFEAFAAYVQALPAATGGSLLEARLDAVSHALGLRRRAVQHAPDDDVAARHGVWTFVAVASALLRDLGRDVLTHRVELCDDKGRKLGEWEPWAGPVSLRAAKSVRLRPRHAPLP
ncbi:MAG TPA: TraI domain-containing protein, partial [Nevskiaceae bacterium]|nr:TraI domain-containing protein [Nevskiaceae bacterium]